ncbi:MAG: hypothetical protein DMD59_07695 [Gemmatimonadetes bacterium]|nr:MAG: hypothetical protein DMD59_07695 [Gemmatimonadota bacterium]
MTEPLAALDAFTRAGARWIHLVEARFLARTLSDVARVPVKVFVETEAGRWRDGASLAPVATPELTRAAAGARLVVAMGDPERARAFTGARQIAMLGVDVIVSGGVGSLDDLRAARAAGLAGACVGRALYDGKFTIAEALACVS